MDPEYGKGRPSGVRYRRLFCLLFGVLALMSMLVAGLVSYIHSGATSAHGSEVESGRTSEIPPGYHGGSPVPEEQLSMASENAPEVLVVQEQEGQLHAHGDDYARRYTEEQATEGHNFARRYTEEQVAEDDPEAQEQGPPPFKLPKLPIPSDILDIPIKIPTHISDIIGDLPALPTIPTDQGDIIDILPTDPGELISDLPMPPLPTIPPVPKLPVPVPIPTKLPELPIDPTGTDLPHVPLPTTLLPGLPRDPGDGLKLPDLTEIPHRVLGLLHGAISKLSTHDDLPQPLRDILRLILRILNRLAGGDPVPKPKPPGPTLPLPTKTTLPTLPIPKLPIRPRPTLTLPARARKARDGGSDGDEPLSDGQRKQLRDAVSDEVWASADWSNPILGPITAAGAMVAFDAVYRVAGAFKGTEDEAEQESLLGLFVVVDDDVVA